MSQVLGAPWPRNVAQASCYADRCLGSPQPQSFHLEDPCSSWTQLLESKSCPRDRDSTRHVCCICDAARKGNNTSATQEGITQHALVTLQMQAGKYTLLYSKRDENVQHRADSKEKLLLANQKDYFTMLHMNRNEPPATPTNIPSASNSYRFNKVQDSSSFCQCRVCYISLHAPKTRNDFATHQS